MLLSCKFFHFNERVRLSKRAVALPEKGVVDMPAHNDGVSEEFKKKVEELYNRLKKTTRYGS